MKSRMGISLISVSMFDQAAKRRKIHKKRTWPVYYQEVIRNKTNKFSVISVDSVRNLTFCETINIKSSIINQQSKGLLWTKSR